MGKRGLLVLSRKINERIVINDGEIEIVVVDIRGDKVRIGVSAPNHISVHRDEVIRRIADNNLQDGSDEKA